MSKSNKTSITNETKKISNVNRTSKSNNTSVPRRTSEKKNHGLELFLTFCKIGLFTFGGGYAMIPLIQKETVEKHKWISDEDILDIVAIAESTPGPIAINAATFVGFKVGGFLGAFFASFGVILPSFMIILAISFVLREFQNIRAVQYAFFGIRAGVLALIVKALVSMYRQNSKGIVPYTIAFLSFLAVAFFNVNVLLVIAACALVGLCSSFLEVRKQGGAK